MVTSIAIRLRIDVVLINGGISLIHAQDQKGKKRKEREGGREKKNGRRRSCRVIKGRACASRVKFIVIEATPYSFSLLTPAS